MTDATLEATIRAAMRAELEAHRASMRAELEAHRAAVRADFEGLRAVVADALAGHHRDPRAQPFAVAALAFAGRGVWSAGELDDDARQRPGRAGDAALLAVIAQIVGKCPREHRAMRLGKWLSSRQAQIRTPEARLTRAKKVDGVWMWAFEPLVR